MIFKRKSRHHRQLHPLWVISGVALLLLLLPIVYVLLRNPDTTDAAWFDDAWTYRQRIPITAHSAVETNVYNEIVIDTAALTTDKLQADCDDLRFTKENGQILPYQIVSGCDTATTTIRVGFDTMPIAPFNIYMYYGNPTAQIGSSTLPHSECGNGCAEGTAAAEEKGTGPVGYWKFDEGQGSTAYDSTANGVNGTISGASWQTEDKCISGKCLYLDGSDDYIQIPTAKIINPAAGSVSLWIKPLPGSEANYFIFSHPGGGSNSRIYITTNATGTIINGGLGSSGLLGSTTVTANTWHHVVLAWDNTSGSLFVDGNSVFSNASITALSATVANFFIGGLNTTSENFKGFVDELKIYNYARSATQIKADFAARGSSEGAGAVMGASNQKALSDGLVGYWKMDETSWNGTSNEVADASGNNRTGTASCDGSGCTVPSTSVGKFGNSFSGDGTEDFVSVTDTGDTYDFGTGDFSLNLWVYQTGTKTSPGLISKNASPGYRFRLIAGSPSKLRVGIYDGATWNESDSTNITLSQNVWTMFTVSVDRDGIVSFYKDGAFLSTGSLVSAASVNISNTSPLRIGDDNWSRVTGSGWFDGKIDEVRIYNRAIFPAEVKALYAWAPGPVAHWKMDEGAGSTIYDISGSSLTGSLTATTWSSGKYGKALEFNGTTSNANIYSTGLNSIFNGNEGTLEAWIRIKDSSVWTDGVARRAISIRSGTNDVIYIRKETTNNTLTVNRVANNVTDTTSISASSTEWMHVAMTWSVASDQLKMYLNGIQQSTTQTTLAGWTGTGLEETLTNIGSFDTTQLFWKGLIDDVIIYNYARTPGQVVEDMNGGSPISGSILPDPISYWKFDEGQGQIANNSGIVGSASVGTLGGATTIGETDDPTWKTKNECVMNGCMNFDGGDYIDLVGDTTYMTDNKTITFWAKPNGTVSATIPILSSSGANWYAGFASGNAMILSRSVAAGTQQATYSSTNVVIPNEWHHYGYKVIVNGSNVSVSFYRDTKLINTVNYTTGNSTTYSSTWIIGGFSTTTNFYNGLVDELKFYNSPLTDEQLKLDMNAGGAINFGATANSESSLLADGAGNPPVAYWSMDEKQDNTCAGGVNDVCDKSGKGNDGANTNGPTWTQGKYGSAIQFDGSNDYVSVANSSTLQFSATDSFTTCLWFQMDTGEAVNGAYLFDNRENNYNEGYFMYVNAATATLIFGIEDINATSQVNVSSALQDNRWYHACGVRNVATDTLSLYLDGRLVDADTDTTTETLTHNEVLTLGKGGAGVSAGELLDGKIDEVKIYNYARTPAQIAYDYNRGAPIGWWKFDECEGTTVYDASGNGNNGTIEVGDGTGDNDAAGTCASASSTEMWGEGVSGKYNSSLGFDGTNDWVNAGVDTRFEFQPTTPFSVSFWMNKNNISSRGIITKRHDSTAAGWEIQTNSSGFIFILGSAGSFKYSVYSSLNMYTASDWYHVVATYDGSQSTSGMKIYVNGNSATLTSVDNDSEASITYGSDTLEFGTQYNNDPNYFFNGKLDDIRIYNYVLSQDQIKKLYNENGTVRFGS